MSVLWPGKGGVGCVVCKLVDWRHDRETGRGEVRGLGVLQGHQLKESRTMDLPIVGIMHYP